MRSTCARIGAKFDGRSISATRPGCAADLLAAVMPKSPPSASEFFNRCRRSILPTPRRKHPVRITWGRVAQWRSNFAESDSSLGVCAMQQKAGLGLSRRIFLNRLRQSGGQDGMGAMIATAHKSTLVKAAVIAAFVLAGAANSEAQPTGQVDLLIRNGHVVDGNGGPWFQADVAITGDRIVYVGRAPV